MKSEKLGRNPFKKPISEKSKKNPEGQTSLPFISESKLDRLPILDRVQGLGIEVDWEEFLRATVGSKIQWLSRYFLRF
jgi:hypothetical protein